VRSCKTVVRSMQSFAHLAAAEKPAAIRSGHQDQQTQQLTILRSLLTRAASWPYTCNETCESDTI